MSSVKKIASSAAIYGLGVIFVVSVIPDELWALPLEGYIVLFAMMFLFFTPIIEKQHRLYARQAARKFSGEMIKKDSV